ncbi:MAG TPA: DUF4145 domain-containing protein [Acidimicrobiales bacterium]|nr:DUF4145 domain-containing protein [Acidimicrobiales bacterium]
MTSARRGTLRGHASRPPDRAGGRRRPAGPPRRRPPGGRGLLCLRRLSGAGLLARRTVEQVVVMRGVPLEMRTLQQKIAWLLTAGHLPRSLAAEARTVRDVGTAAAHGGEPVTAEEAEAVVRAALAIARAAVLPNG